MKLRVGIIGNQSHGWELLLDQEGLWYEYVSDTGDLDYSIIICSDRLTPESGSFVKEFLRKGGAVLCSGEIFASISGKRYRRTKIRYLLPERNSSFAAMGMLDADIDCNIAYGANYLKTDRGTNSLFAGEFGGGFVAALPFDAGQLAAGTGDQTKSFYAKRSRLPFERVASVNKGALRRLVSSCIAFLHHRRGLPYVHKWYYPNDNSSVFLFRIDTDYADKDAIQQLHELCARNNIPATWFADTKSQKDFIGLFAGFSGNETGIHCYEHETYPDAESNKENIVKAKRILEQAGINPKGFAAPFGRWNNGIAEAIRSFGFEYSSEFSYDYDNLPSFPVTMGGRSPVLQVPVHPVSIGGLRRQGFTTEEMIGYFRDVIARKKPVHDPMFFYHHPNDGNTGAVQYVFQTMAESHIPAMTMLEYARWWKRRNQIRYTAEYRNGEIAISSADSINDVCFSILNQENERAFVLSPKVISERDLPWNKEAEPAQLPDDILRTVRFNLWVPLIRLEDVIHRLF